MAFLSIPGNIHKFHPLTNPNNRKPFCLRHLYIENEISRGRNASRKRKTFSQKKGIESLTFLYFLHSLLLFWLKGSLFIRRINADFFVTFYHVIEKKNSIKMHFLIWSYQMQKQEKDEANLTNYSFFFLYL